MIIIKVDCSAQILAVMDNITQASLKSLVIFFFILWMEDSGVLEK